MTMCWEDSITRSSQLRVRAFARKSLRMCCAVIQVYAPWCGHCKKLDPIYKKLAKRFKKVNTVVIAKMDGTENEHPLIDAKGFPTIIFYPAGADSKPITFEGGDRSLKSLTKFIKVSIQRTLWESPSNWRTLICL